MLLRGKVLVMLTIELFEHFVKHILRTDRAAARFFFGNGLGCGNIDHSIGDAVSQIGKGLRAIGIGR